MTHPSTEALDLYAVDVVKFHIRHGRNEFEMFERHLSSCDECKAYVELLRLPQKKRRTAVFQQLSRSLELREVVLPERYLHGEKCLDDNTLVALEERLLPRWRLWKARRHLRKCPYCRFISQKELSFELPDDGIKPQPYGSHWLVTLFSNTKESLIMIPAKTLRYAVLVVVVVFFGYSGLAATQYFQLRALRAKYINVLKENTALQQRNSTITHDYMVRLDDLGNKLVSMQLRGLFSISGGANASLVDSLLLSPARASGMLPHIASYKPENGEVLSGKRIAFVWSKPRDITGQAYFADEYELTIELLFPQQPTMPKIVYAVTDTIFSATIQGAFESGKTYRWKVRPFMKDLRLPLLPESEPFEFRIE